MASPSEILRKTKKAEDKKPDEKDDDKKAPAKGGKRNALIDFIAKCKKS